MSLRPKYLEIESFMFQKQRGQVPIVGWGKSVHRNCDSIAPRLKSIVSEMYSYRKLFKNSHDELPPDTRYPWDDGLIKISKMDEWGNDLGLLVQVNPYPENDPSGFLIEYWRPPNWDGPDEDWVEEATGVEEMVKKVLDYLWICQLRNVKAKHTRSIHSLQTLAGRVALTVRDEYGVPVISLQDLQERGIHDDLHHNKLPQITKDEYIASRAPGANPFDFGKKRRLSRRKRKSKIKNSANKVLLSPVS